MRGAVADLPVSRSLTEGLPVAFFADPSGADTERFAYNLVAAFDQVLAPVLASLDSIHAYMDPRTAPPDFVPWLAGWLGLAVGERWPAHRARSFVEGAAEAFRWRGTRRGIALAVRAYTGVEPDIDDTGGVGFSLRPGGPVPGDQTPFLRVRVVVGDAEVDEASVDRIVADAKPAHVPHRVEVVQRGWS
jgi:phage tail-like protein